jgi:hypothetical protein
MVTTIKYGQATQRWVGVKAAFSSYVWVAQVNDSLLRTANHQLSIGEGVVHLVNDLLHSSSARVVSNVAHTSLHARESDRRIQRTKDRGWYYPFITGVPLAIHANTD